MTKSKVKILNNISLNRNEHITVELPCGSRVNIYTHDSSSHVGIGHYAEGPIKKIEVNYVGTRFNKEYAHATCESEWGTREEKSHVSVSHTAHYSNKEVA